YLRTALLFQGRSEHFKRVGLVINQQHPQAVYLRLASERRDLRPGSEDEPSSRSSSFFAANAPNRESHCEDCALSFSATFGLDCPAMHLDNLTHNRQPQTKSTIFSRAGAVGLSKTVKD